MEGALKNYMIGFEALGEILQVNISPRLLEDGALNACLDKERYLSTYRRTKRLLHEL